MRTGPPDWVRAASGLTVVGWGANQFAALLPVYRESGGLPDAFVSLAFATYVVGLVPALFLAAEVADRVDRRWPVRLAVVLSGAASVVLCLGAGQAWLLVVGRLLSGAAAGAVLGPGTAWVTELSGDDRPAAPRRVAIALSLGLGGGPLLAGLVAQWAPWPEVTPYLLHLMLSVAAGALLWGAPDPSPGAADHAATGPGGGEGAGGAPSFRRAITSRPFLWAVPLTAPWVFGTVTMSFAVLPSVVHVPGLDAVTAGVVTGITMGTGVLVQPLAQRLERARPGAALPTGMALAAVGMALAASGLAVRAPALLPPTAVVLGAAYGLVLVSGLRRTGTLGRPRDRARLNAAYYSLTYIGFAQPFVFAVVATTRAGQVGYAVVGAVVAAATAVGVGRGTVLRERSAEGRRAAGVCPRVPED